MSGLLLLCVWLITVMPRSSGTRAPLTHECVCANSPREGGRWRGPIHRPGLGGELVRCTDTSSDCAQSALRTRALDAAISVARLRGGANTQRGGVQKMVLVPGDRVTGMDGVVKVVREARRRKDPQARVRAAARALEKLIHDTERRDWPKICGRPATREQVSAHLRTKDCTFPDADDSPRLNAHLAAAASSGNVSAIRRLAAEGAQVNAGVTGSSQWTALHYAVRHRRHNGVRALLDLGAKVNVSTWGRWSPLHLAAALLDVDMAHVLLEAGLSYDLLPAPTHLSLSHTHSLSLPLSLPPSLSLPLPLSLSARSLAVFASVVCVHVRQCICARADARTLSHACILSRSLSHTPQEPTSTLSTPMGARQWTRHPRATTGRALPPACCRSLRSLDSLLGCKLQPRPPWSSTRLSCPGLALALFPTPTS